MNARSAAADGVAAWETTGGALKVEVLGPLRVVRNGVPLVIARPKTRLLLARLAVATPRSVSVAALIDALWGEDPPATARKTLQKYISELRKALGDLTVRTDDAGYALVIDPLDVDAAAFHALVDRARSERAAGRPDRAWELYGQAEQLWRGDPFAGLGDGDFVTTEAARLENAQVAAVEEQLAVGLDLGKHDQLIANLEQLVVRHPLRERLWASLMTALYRSGRQAEALEAYRRARTVLVDELGVEPSPELVALHEKMLLHDEGLASAPHARDAGNLPAGFTSFVGRSTELSQLSEVLTTSRLVTLTGPGGSGKTRLALELGATLRTRFPDGAWIVDLAPLHEPGQVVPCVAATFGIVQEANAPLDHTVLEFLRARDLLLVLDNCEHVVVTAAGLARGVLGATAATTIVATSREPLGLTGEVVYPVTPLAIPEPHEDEAGRIASIDSVRLFTDRAGAADREFRLTDAVAADVAEICRRLDGLPLAIELAARQLHVLGLQELRRGLIDHLDLLTAPGEPDDRHRTMQAAIDWSYRLLDDAQQSLWVALSVFSGDFSADAVEQVCGTAGVPVGATAVPALTALASRSMVVRRPVGDSTRYRLLAPLSAFGRERAAGAGRSDALHRAHAQWVLDLLVANAQILGPGERQRLRLLAAESHHFGAALAWAADHDPDMALRIVAAASEYLWTEDFPGTWAEDLERALAAGSSSTTTLRAEAHAKAALALSERVTDYRAAKTRAEVAARLAQDAGDEMLVAVARIALAVALRTTGDLQQAHALITDVIETFDRLGEPAWSARSRHWLGHIELGQGHYDAVIAACTEAVALWREVGSDLGAAKAWWVLAAAHALQSEHELAEDAAGRALTLLEGFDHPSQRVHIRAVQGDSARLAGSYERAQTIYRECLTGFEAIGDRRCTVSSLKNLGVVELHLDRPQEAARLMIAALERRSALGDEAGLPECLEGLALVAHRRSDGEVAVTLFAAADRLRVRSGTVAPGVEREEIEAALDALRASLSSAQFEQAWRRGAAFEPSDVVAETRELTPRLLSAR